MDDVMGGDPSEVFVPHFVFLGCNVLQDLLHFHFPHLGASGLILVMCFIQEVKRIPTQTENEGLIQLKVLKIETHTHPVRQHL